MARDLLRNAQKNPCITAEKSSKHRSSCSQDNNKQQRLTFQSCQKEQLQHKIKCLKKKKPEAFWNNVLWTDKTKIELFDHH